MEAGRRRNRGSRRTTLAAGVAGALACSCATVPHFDELTLDPNDWRELGSAAWRFDAGGVAAGPSGETGFLVSRAEYDDFRLTVEFRIDDETNSGVFLRCTNPRAVADVNPLDCYEVNIWDNHPNQDFRTGSIVSRVSPSTRVDSLGHWNTYEIDVRGPRIEVSLNGRQTAALTDRTLKSGVIALQYAGGGKLRFRNLELEPY